MKTIVFGLALASMVALAQIGDQYRAAANTYREMAARANGAQRQCYLAYATYHDCLAASLQRGGPGSCGEPSCLLGGASGGSSNSSGTAFGGTAGGGGGYRGTNPNLQRSLDQGFDALRGMIQSHYQDRLRQTQQAQQRREQEQFLQDMEELRKRMAQEEEELDREIAAADRQQSERDASRILSAADEILRAGGELADRSPVSPQGDALARANGDRCVKGWEDTNYTITAWGNDRLWIRGDALAFITDESGSAKFTGGYLQISHGTAKKTHFYFGLSGVLNNDLAPGESKMVGLPFYRSNADLRPTEVEIRARYCLD